jgi:hypothetical protein
VDNTILLADGPPLERRQPAAQVPLRTPPAPDASFPLRRLCGHRLDTLPNAIVASELPARRIFLNCRSKVVALPFLWRKLNH